MKRAYSKDIRELAIKKYENKETTKEIGESLKITKRTIQYWIKEYKETGKKEPISYSERAKGKPSKKRQIKNEKKFENFVKENQFLTHKQLAEKWNHENCEKVTKNGVFSALKRIEFTLKKTTKKYYQRNEELRKIFLQKSEELKDKKFFF